MSVTRNDTTPLSAAQRCFVAMNTEGEKPEVGMATVIVHALFALRQMRTIDPSNKTAELRYGFENGEFVLLEDGGELLFELLLDYGRRRSGREVGSCAIQIGSKQSPWVRVFDTNSTNHLHPADANDTDKMSYLTEPAVELWGYIKNRLEQEHGLY